MTLIFVYVVPILLLRHTTVAYTTLLAVYRLWTILFDFNLPKAQARILGQVPKVDFGFNIKTDPS